MSRAYYPSAPKTLGPSPSLLNTVNQSTFYSRGCDGERGEIYIVVELCVVVQGVSTMILILPFFFSCFRFALLALSRVFWGAFLSLSLFGKKGPFWPTNQPASCLAPPAAFACLQKIANGQHDPRVSLPSLLTAYSIQYTLLHSRERENPPSSQSFPLLHSIPKPKALHINFLSLLLPSTIVKKSKMKK